METEFSEKRWARNYVRSNRAFFIIIYFWLPWVFMAAHRLSLVAASRDCSLVAVCGLLKAVASLVTEHKL